MRHNRFRLLFVSATRPNLATIFPRRSQDPAVAHQELTHSTSHQLRDGIYVQVESEPNRTINRELLYISKSLAQRHSLNNEQMSASNTKITVSSPKACGHRHASCRVHYQQQREQHQEHHGGVQDGRQQQYLFFTSRRYLYWDRERAQPCLPTNQDHHVQPESTSLNSTVEAIERFNYTVKLMEAIKRHSNDANCQALVIWFTRMKSASGPRSSKAQASSARR